MSNFKITGLGAATTANDAVRLEQLTSGATNVSFNNLAYTGTLTGGTGVINIGSGQVYKDAAGQLGVGFTPLATQGNLQVYKTVSGGGPATSGSTDANQVFAANASSVQLSYGAYATGTGWIQQRAGGNFAVNYDLVLQPNGGSVGIGTASPSGKFNVAGGRAFFGGNSEQYSIGVGYNQTRVSTGAQVYYIGATDSATPSLVFSEAGGTERMRLTSAGNLAIGSTDTDAKFKVELAGVAGMRVGFSGGSTNFYDADLQVFRAGNASTERMRIDSSGNLLVGQSITSTPGEGNTTVGNSILNSGALYASRSGAQALNLNRNTSDGNIVGIFREGNSVGSISVTATTTAYNTTSDYRLKENVAPMQNALTTVAALKPCTYTWKADGSNGQGFIAHELQAVVPDCVTGTKDAIDKDGKPQHQSVDTSFLVATVVAALQELKAEFDAYKLTHP
jgi:hypothetical protein